MTFNIDREAKVINNHGFIFAVHDALSKVNITSYSQSRRFLHGLVLVTLHHFWWPQKGDFYSICGVHPAIWLGSNDADRSTRGAPRWLLHKYAQDDHQCTVGEDQKSTPLLGYPSNISMNFDCQDTVCDASNWLQETKPNIASYFIRIEMIDVPPPPEEIGETNIIYQCA